MSDVMTAKETDKVLSAVQALQRRVEELEAREAIREVLGKYCRGVDRLDHEVLMSCYHPDATDEHGFFTAKSAKEFADRAIEGARLGFERTIYSLGTILIRLEGNIAHVESYCTSAKILNIPDDNGQKQMRLSGVRFVDRFEKRNGEWRIAYRRLMGEWGIFHPTPTKTVGSFKHPPDETMPMLGRRDKTDPSYSI